MLQDRCGCCLSEGNSTSAREAVTILGLAGRHVEVCDLFGVPILTMYLIPTDIVGGASSARQRLPRG
jgi:hypothetical protein